MTVSYSASVATANSFTFLKLLLRWKASVYKLLWKDLICFILLFYLMRIIYMFLPDWNQKQFESLVQYSKKYGSSIPLSFVLGFFVSTVMSRWWSQFQSIPYPTPLGVLVSSSLHGYDEVGRSMRRTIMRYACLSLTLVFRVLSPRVKSRFPKLRDLVKSGLLLHDEMDMLENLEEKFPGYSKSWMPIIWAANIVTRARKEGRITNDYAANSIVEQLNIYRGKCTKLMSYHSIQIPLVYVQVVTIAVYFYFIIALFAEQEIRSDTSTYVGYDSFGAHPIILTLEFIFYMGWLKVAEALLNPFGMDDDDFDVNSMIDRNLQMSYLIIDDMHNEHPVLRKDLHWDQIPQSLPDRTKNIFPDPEVLDTDIIDYDVKAHKSVFGKVSIAVRRNKKVDVEKGRLERRLSTIDNQNLIPDASVICEIYKNLPKVEEEQNALNQELEQHRRRSEAEARSYRNSRIAK